MNTTFSNLSKPQLVAACSRIVAPCAVSLLMSLPLISAAQETSIDNEPPNSSQHIEQVDINSASAIELAKKLKGIGSVKAKAIVDYRQTNGLFRSIEDLINVKGISSKTIANNYSVLKALTAD